jgi:bifunctional DNA-binding transcriptional regulator/antitoxin component of YhaV-PrlF toxin-antitoxin module
MTSLNGESGTVPQVVAITSISTEGKLTLKKAIRQYIGLQTGQLLFLDVGAEILLSMAATGMEVPVDRRNRISLPERVLEKFGIAERTLVGLIQRPDAVAVKRVEIAKEAGEWARLVDVETTYTLTRLVETNPMPKDLLPKLEAQYRDLSLRYDVAGFLRGKQTLPAWKARGLLGGAEPSDDALREGLIQERLEGQGEDGSWENQVVVTARNLRELADLGMTAEDEPIQRAVDWLLARPQSIHNPGMFFAADELVAEQARIVAERQSGNRLRFREMKRSEQKRVMAGDDLIRTPCGPRIMWPNALVLEVLLRLGYEQHERVQLALSFMRTHDWCECGYQHGGSGWKDVEPLGMEEVEAFERLCINQFRYGGIRTIKELEQADMAHQPFQLSRVAYTVTSDGDEYPLQMPDHIQGCEFITTRAMSHVRDPKMQRFAEAHLWRFASRQRAPSGEFAKERHGSGFSQEGILEAVARYDHPASKVIVWRSLPWIVEAQNEDGSWGQGPYKDASTLAVLSALDSVGWMGEKC